MLRYVFHYLNSKLVLCTLYSQNNEKIEKFVELEAVYLGYQILAFFTVRRVYSAQNREDK